MRWFLVALIVMLLPTEALAPARTWKEAEKDKIFVTCRLAKKKIVITQKICLYQGANRTRETIFISKFEYCPRTIQCVYEPNKQAPMIQEMLESIEDAMRSKK